MSKFRWAILFAVILCGAPAFSAEPDFPQSELVVNISASFPDMRPHLAYNADEAQVMTAMYEGLFVYDPYNLDPVPGIAESWTESQDGLEWTFTIRRNARFSNGDFITARTVRDSWLNLLRPSVNAPYASLLDCIEGAADYRTGKTSDPAAVGIRADSTYKLTVKLAMPAQHLPKILCHHAFSAVHPSNFKAATETKKGPGFKPVSSGPFSIDSVSDTEIYFVKNPYYWDKEQVYLPGIRVIIDNDAESLTARFNRGEIQWLAGAMLLNRILDISSIQIAPMFSTEYLFFRTTWGPWQNPKIREALLLAVPWTRLREDYLIPATTLVFPIVGYPEVPGINTEDMEKAKALIAENLPPEISVPPLVIYVPESEYYFGLAEKLKPAWEELGFEIEVRSRPYTEYYATLRKDDYTLGVTSWIGDFADPLAFLEMFRPASSLNDSGWKNTTFEKYITDAASRKTAKERYELLADAEKVLLKDSVILPLSHNPSVNVIDREGLAGWYANALDIHPFKFMYFIQRPPLPGVVLAY
ncbi:peptide ABC transporter substrate-binding protein [Brucepastera parasyntrophica]|uniref:peptide ABC transporter substrate-binding protein n=1 Tax=Brucepastera parasyntrophica TaxID=2880008 RepID=UPI00210A4A82|nr:peptide ABC transporter substrate-binding protein [Brucepastera parasyntrophica]ULQ59369.1 peptide ABC transporter substrate-binding protein [Brucepastera parasyntrophica]